MGEVVRALVASGVQGSPRRATPELRRSPRQAGEIVNCLPPSRGQSRKRSPLRRATFPLRALVFRPCRLRKGSRPTCCRARNPLATSRLCARRARHAPRKNRLTGAGLMRPIHHDTSLSCQRRTGAALSRLPRLPAAQRSGMRAHRRFSPAVFRIAGRESSRGAPARLAVALSHSRTLTATMPASTRSRKSGIHKSPRRPGRGRVRIGLDDDWGLTQARFAGRSAGPPSPAPPPTSR